MNGDLAIVLGLLGLAIAMFALNRPRMDAVALIMLTALTLSGILPLADALAGFSDPNVLLIAALFVIGEGLVRAGVARHIGDLLSRHAGKSETRLIVLLMVLVAATGAFMSSTGVVAIFIPIVLRIARATGIAPGRLMMPLSMAALISGMMTLVATAPNLIINAQLNRTGLHGFSFFAFTPFGVAVLALGVVYMLAARRFLAAENRKEAAMTPRPSLREWVEEYALAGREHRVTIRRDSHWAGKRLDQLNLRATEGVNLIAIEKRGNFFADIQTLRPAADTVLAAGDTLFLDLHDPGVDLEALCQRHGLRQRPLTGPYFHDHLQQVGMAELMLPTASPLIGKTILETRLRSRFDLTVIGLKRGNRALRHDLLKERLQMGDMLLVAGPWRAIRNLTDRHRELIVFNIAAEFDEVLPAPKRAPFALAALGLTIALMVSGLTSNLEAALIGCLLMGLTGCIDMGSAYRAINWQSLMVIVGMMPFSLALQKTGGVDLAATALLSALGEAAPHMALAAIFLLTALLGLFISNTATAVLMAPVAITLATGLGVSPYPFAMTVALAASAAFMTPVSSPVNTLVTGPGDYTFTDFARIGIPFAAITLLLTVFAVPLLFPF